jgi:hypothetical protein
MWPCWSCDEDKEEKQHQGKFGLHNIVGAASHA